MIKNRKLSFVIALVVAIVSAGVMGIVFVVASSNTENVLVNDAETNMKESLNSKAQLIEQYISNAETTLLSFSKSGELKNFYKDVNDVQNQEIAQNYNSEFYTCIPNWEGIYSDNWSTRVYTHSTKSVVGMVTRKGETSRWHAFIPKWSV